MCAAVAAAAMFLPWHTTVAASGTETVQGTGVNEGQLVLVVGLISVGLIQVGWRPAWIGVGFAGAITVREILDLSGGEADAAAGLWIAAAASIVAVILLVWDMLTGVTAPGDDTGEPDKPGGRGLSGPLGKRRQ